MDAGRPSPSLESLASQIGRADAPLIVDVRKRDDYLASDFYIPGALRWDYLQNADPPSEISRHSEAIAYCVKGQQVGLDGARRLCALGLSAVPLEGGFRAWQAEGLPIVRKRPDLGVTGEAVSHWVTRARPKIDRIACPWLVRRFIDPRAKFHYVPTSDVFDFAKAIGGIAFDIPGAPLEHDGPLCSFDTVLREFGLSSPALSRLARIVRGSDTDALDLAPQCAGLLAISLGMSLTLSNDQAMLEAMMPVYDALYRWCLDGGEEKHNWKPA